MKRISKINILTILLAGSLLSGCSNELDIEPKNSVDAGMALNTSNDVKAALVGAYTALVQNGTSSESLYGGRLMVSTDLMAYTSDLSFGGTYTQYLQMSRRGITANNSFVANIWTTAYNAINVCNNVLNKIDIVSSDSKDRVEGEAKFLRGLIYFDLVRTYSRAWNDGNPETNPGVPIILTPTTPQNIAEAKNVTRGTVAAVYAQAIKDLTEAEAKLPDENGSFATTYAASSILARIYLTQEKFELAETEASKVLAANFTLMTSYKDEFPDPDPASHVNNTTEDVFAIQISNQAGFNSFNEVYAPTDKSGRGELLITEAYLDRFESNDVRGKFYQGDRETGELYTKKFFNAYGNVKMIRLAELYLIRAEARVRKSSPDIDGALSDLNMIRRRAGLTDFESSNPSSIFEEVKLQRFLELSFEGQRLYDIKRYKENVTNDIPYNSKRLIFPIPQREIDANTNLVQN